MKNNILKAFNLKKGESLSETLFFDTLKKQGIQKYDPRIIQKAIQKDNIIPDFESLSYLHIHTTCH